jgi:hypothetical protein
MRRWSSMVEPFRFSSGHDEDHANRDYPVHHRGTHLPELTRVCAAFRTWKGSLTGNLKIISRQPNHVYRHTANLRSWLACRHPLRISLGSGRCVCSLSELLMRIRPEACDLRSSVRHSVYQCSVQLLRPEWQLLLKLEARCYHTDLRRPLHVQSTSSYCPVRIIMRSRKHHCPRAGPQVALEQIVKVPSPCPHLGRIIHAAEDSSCCAIGSRPASGHRRLSNRAFAELETPALEETIVPHMKFTDAISNCIIGVSVGERQRAVVHHTSGTLGCTEGSMSSSTSCSRTWCCCGTPRSSVSWRSSATSRWTQPVEEPLCGDCRT